MSEPVYRAQGETQAQVVQRVLGCDAERAQRVVRRLGGLLTDPETRAFLLRFGEVSGVPMQGMTGERALIHIGRRELAMFLVRCAGRTLDPATYEETADD